MNGSNGDCTCDELIAAGKCVPPPRFHDCDYVRARGEYEDFVTGFVMRDGMSGADPSESPSRKMAASFSAKWEQHDLAGGLSEVRTSSPVK